MKHILIALAVSFVSVSAHAGVPDMTFPDLTFPKPPVTPDTSTQGCITTQDKTILCQ